MRQTEWKSAAAAAGGALGGLGDKANILYGNLACYVFFRFYQKLYQRLAKVRVLSEFAVGCLGGTLCRAQVFQYLAMVRRVVGMCFGVPDCRDGWVGGGAEWKGCESE